jgi:molecular chaperone GrpE
MSEHETPVVDEAPPVQPAPGGGDLSEQLAERTDDLKRVTAEYANYRRRVDRDRTLVVDQPPSGSRCKLFPIVDDIERARDHGDLTGAFKVVAERVLGLLDGLGVEPFGVAGDPFDPSLHEAVIHDTSSEVSVPDRDDGAPAGFPPRRTGAADGDGGGDGPESRRPAAEAPAEPPGGTDGRRPPSALTAPTRREGAPVSTRDFIEKDYYAALGVPKDADAAAIKKAYRKLARTCTRTRTRQRRRRGPFKEVSEAYDVLSDTEAPGEYDDARRLFGAAAAPGGFPGGFPVAAAARRSTSATCSAGRRTGRRTAVPGASATCSAACSAAPPAARSARARSQAASGPARGQDVETEATLSFDEAVLGVTCRCACRARAPARPATATAQSRAPARTPVRSVRARASPVAARARSPSPSRAATAAAPARSSTTPARPAPAAASPPRPHDHRPHPGRRQGRPAHPAGGQGRPGTARRTGGRPLRRRPRRRALAVRPQG